MIRWNDVGERLEAARREGRGIVLSTHVSADGDGLGSELGFYHFLKSRGHSVRIVNSEPVPDRYRFLPGSEEILPYDPRSTRDLIRNAALFFVLDNSSPERLGPILEDLKAGGPFKICIDHHVTIDPFWDLNCVDTDAAASGQLVYQAIKALGGSITPPIAVALYVSFVTDTGHFRFSKTTPEVHRINAELIEIGKISPPAIYTAVFEGISPGLARMIGLAMGDVRYECGGRFAWARFTRSQLEECDGFEEDTGDLINMILAIRGVDAVAVFKELHGGRTKVSLRSRGDIDVNKLASRFGGGGHMNASGVVLEAPLEEGIARVVDGMKEVLAGNAS